MFTYAEASSKTGTLNVLLVCFSTDVADVTPLDTVVEFRPAMRVMLSDAVSCRSLLFPPLLVLLLTIVGCMFESISVVDVSMVMAGVLAVPIRYCESPELR